MNTLNKECSEALQKAGIEGVSEKWWYTTAKAIQNIDENSTGYGSIIRMEQISAVDTISEAINDMVDSKPHYPAYNLQETITLLLKIGEKLGWREDQYATSSTYHREETGEDMELLTSETLLYAHKILDIYITDGMEGVSNYLLELLKK